MSASREVVSCIQIWLPAQNVTNWLKVKGKNFLICMNLLKWPGDSLSIWVRIGTYSKAMLPPRITCEPLRMLKSWSQQLNILIKPYKYYYYYFHFTHEVTHRDAKDWLIIEWVFWDKF